MAQPNKVTPATTNKSKDKGKSSAAGAAVKAAQKRDPTKNIASTQLI